MRWFEGKLYLGTTRQNLCMLKLQSAYGSAPMSTWPIECPDTMDDLYKLDRRAQIWAVRPGAGDMGDGPSRASRRGQRQQ